MDICITESLWGPPEIQHPIKKIKEATKFKKPKMSLQLALTQFDLYPF